MYHHSDDHGSPPHNRNQHFGKHPGNDCYWLGVFDILHLTGVEH